PSVRSEARLQQVHGGRLREIRFNARRQASIRSPTRERRERAREVDEVLGERVLLPRRQRIEVGGERRAGSFTPNGYDALPLRVLLGRDGIDAGAALPGDLDLLGERGAPCRAARFERARPDLTMPERQTE